MRAAAAGLGVPITAEQARALGRLLVRIEKALR
jgi:hypothetical protein